MTSFLVNRFNEKHMAQNKRPTNKVGPTTKLVA